MEDGLEHIVEHEYAPERLVLILVVMEDGLELNKHLNIKLWQQFVLILVVMEDGLELLKLWLINQLKLSLNPCCNGRWSRTVAVSASQLTRRSLNPCCNGRWSRTPLQQCCGL